MRLRREIPHTLAGAYALDALTEADRVRFERHLAGCDACRQEAGSLRETVGRLPAVTAVPPPGHVREQVLAEAARTRQQPPLTEAGPALSAAGWRGLGRRAPRMAVAIAGGCMLVALVLGGLFINTQHRLSQEQAHTGAIATVLNAPDATIMSARATTGGTATVVMSHRDRALVLTTASLPGPPVRAALPGVADGGAQDACGRHAARAAPGDDSPHGRVGDRARGHGGPDRGAGQRVGLARLRAGADARPAVLSGPATAVGRTGSGENPLW